jgi:hypothetical protein
VDNKQVKRTLKDIELYCTDARKAWPRYPDVALVRIEAARELIEQVIDYVDRPMGKKEGSR